MTTHTDGVGSNVDHRYMAASGMSNCSEIFNIWDTNPDGIETSDEGDTFDDKLVALRECIGKLPENYRDTVLLRYEKGLKPAELAATISRNAETVKKRLHRAKTMLLHCIRRKLTTELSGA